MDNHLVSAKSKIKEHLLYLWSQVDTAFKNTTFFSHEMHAEKSCPAMSLKNFNVLYVGEYTSSIWNASLELFGWGITDKHWGDFIELLMTYRDPCSSFGYSIMRLDQSKQDDTKPLSVAYISIVSHR